MSSNFAQKLSRWPFQETVAIMLDKVQCKMLAHIILVPRAAGEDIDHLCRQTSKESCDACRDMEFVMVSSGPGLGCACAKRSQVTFDGKLLTFHNNE